MDISRLIDVLTHLPQSIHPTQRLFVDTHGHIQSDNLPSFMRPILQFLNGGFSRSALVLRLYELSNCLVRFTSDASSCVLPHIQFFQNTGIVLSSVDVCLFHIRSILEHMDSFTRIIDHVRNIYSLDLVLLQTSVCETKKRLSDLYTQYST
jgi:hypothetical protein